MLDFLDGIAAVGEVIASWRFYLCLVLAAALIALIYSSVPDPWRLVLSVPVAVVAAAVGIIWERHTW